MYYYYIVCTQVEYFRKFRVDVFFYLKRKKKGRNNITLFVYFFSKRKKKKKVDKKIFKESNLETWLQQ